MTHLHCDKSSTVRACVCVCAFVWSCMRACVLGSTAVSARPLTLCCVARVDSQRYSSIGDRYGSATPGHGTERYGGTRDGGERYGGSRDGARYTGGGRLDGRDSAYRPNTSGGYSRWVSLSLLLNAPCAAVLYKRQEFGV